MMKRLGALTILLLLFLLPLPALADTVVEHDPANGPGIGKDMSPGQGGLRCHGEASYQGYTYKLTIYEAQDRDDQDTPGELAWQKNECVHDLQQQMGWWFAQEYDNYYCNGAHMIQGAVPDRNNYCYDKPALSGFDPSTIKITMTRL
jgi:hypothetical protein